jgi:cyclase
MQMTNASGLIFLVLLLSALASGQGFGNFTPAEANSGFDISGAWIYAGHQDAGLGTAAGAIADYGGIPLSEAGRLYALAWDASRMTVRQQQCAGYNVPYAFISPGNFRFWEERDPVTQTLIAIKMYFQTSEVNRTIWMDGRPHPPPNAEHTFAGFSTGRWENNVLAITTTHLKRGWIRGNGVPQSDEATVTEHLIRHGDRITYFSVINDPVFLAEPLSKTVTLQRNVKDPVAWLYACDDGEEILDKAEDRVPSYLFGRNPYIWEYAQRRNIPLLAALGGPETLYPEMKRSFRDEAAAEAAARAKTVPSPGSIRSSVAMNQIPDDGEIHVLPVQGNIYMLAGDGANIVVQAGEQGPLVVDTGAGQLTEKVIAAIRKLTPKPVQFIINTSFHTGHTGGNAKLHEAGADPSLVGSFFSNQFADAGRGATIIAHQNVQNRLSAAGVKPGGWPTDTFLEGRRRKYHNGEAVEIFYEPNAVTDGDSVVQFRRSDVIAAGDIFDAARYPFIDLKNGGSVEGEIKALNNILDKTVYKHDEDGGTMVIPGHGRLCDEYDLAEYRDMLVIIRDRVLAMIAGGATLEQVKAARVTADYDPRYGAATGPWTTGMFIEAVYNSLKTGRR